MAGRPDEPDNEVEPQAITDFRGRGWRNIWGVMLLVFLGCIGLCGYLIATGRTEGTAERMMFGGAMLVALIFRTLDALRVFDVFYVMIGSRPDMQTMATYAHQSLVSISDIGYGSAISVAIFLVIAVFIGLYIVVFRREEDA